MSTMALQMPCSYVNVDRDEMEYVDGGGWFKLSITCTIGGFVSGVASGVVTGFIVGYISAKFTKIGSMAGVAGGLVSAAIGGITGYALSSAVNKMIYGTKGLSKVTLINIWVPIVNFNHTIDIGQKIGSFLGGYGGGLGGAAAATAAGYAYGFATP